MDITYVILRNAIASVSYREDLGPLIDEVKQAKTEGRISILQEQDLLNYIDERMQLPSRPPAGVLTTIEPTNITGYNEEDAIATMPASHPILTTQPENYLENNSFQVIVDGGRRRNRRRNRRTARRNRRRNRRTARRTARHA